VSPDDLVKILLAIVVGGAIGFEREYRDKAAGFRTLIFICLGSTVFTMMSTHLGAGDNDASRIASNIVTGIGFLGAGAIIQDRGRVMGMTTAATIWLVAGLGMAIGAGRYALVLAVTAITLVVLFLFPPIERWIDALRKR
jgi:putative Mg2+ transporter-C (MgtC) family protein